MISTSSLRDSEAPPRREITLTPEQLGDLAEIGNVASGNAAASLSALVRQPCLTDVPTVKFLTDQAIRTAMNADRSMGVAICVRLRGDIPGSVVVMMTRATARRILDSMTNGRLSAGHEEANFTAHAALKQLGARVTTAFADALHEFVGTPGMTSMPTVTTDTWSRGIDLMLEHLGCQNGKKLLVYTSFRDEETTFRGHFVYGVCEASLARLLRRLMLLRRGSARVPDSTVPSLGAGRVTPT